MKGRSLLLGSEIALAAVTLAVVLGMSRLFADGGWLGPLAVNAIAAHAVAAVLRRRGVSLPLAAVLMSLGAALVGTWTSYWWTTAAGIPTGDTWSAMSDDLSGAWALYQNVVAPAPVEVGFVLASSMALWCIAYVADWAAFRLWVPFEATLPAGTLFLFTALLGVERGRGWSVALYAAAFMLFLLVHRLTRQASTSHWVAERRTQGQRSLLTAGAALGAIAVIAGTTLGPAVPGADSPGLVDPRDLRGEDTSRVTVSPLVDIRGRLVEQADVEVFEVESPRDSYWRLTSLDQFDGRRWSSRGGYEEADGDLPSSAPFEVDTETFDQRFTIKALAAIWLPTAFEPRSLDVDDQLGEDVEVLYEEESATLVVANDVDSSNGITYEVASTSPRATAADLAGATGDVPEDIRDRYLTLPDDFSPEVRAEAARITADAGTPYEMAIALQTHLRTFTYDLSVRSGHGENAIEEFLFRTQRGYCEQFAGSFAAMARAVGVPARVAVGFTQGTPDPDRPGVYRVRGEHAHAWPEVYLAGAGWMPFEPTPGRGIPFAESYTGVAPAQAESGRPESATTLPPTTVTTAPGSPGSTPERDVREDDLLIDGGSDPDADSGGEQDSVPVRYLVRPLRTIAPIALALVLLYAIAVPLGLLAGRVRRRRRATTPADLVGLAWAEATDDARLAGYREVPSDTFTERAGRLGARLPAAAGAARLLATEQELATYSAAGADDAGVEIAAEASREIRAAARQQATRLARLRRWFDPRGWLVGRWQSLEDRQRHITGTGPVEGAPEREMVGSRRS
jgi:transglutaminase-like putative cysteine protease